MCIIAYPPRRLQVPPWRSSSSAAEGSLRCGKLSARSRRSGLRSRAEDNKPSSAYHASANTVGYVHSASFACKPSRPHSRHFPHLRSRRYFTITHRKNADGIPSVEIAANATITENMAKRQYLTASFLEYGDLYLNFSGCANDTCQSSGSCNFFKSEARIVSYVATHPPRYHISIR